MLIVDPGKVFRVFFVCSALLVPNTVGLAQKKKPAQSPAQKSAKQPPATENVPANAPPAPVVSPTPTPEPASPEPSSIPEPTAPNFPQVAPRPLPPMPNLTRLGIQSSNVLTLSLNDAIRLALANNNDIEFSRHDVRFAESQLRAFQGVYDPVFAITPQIDKRNTPTQSIFAGGGTSGTVSNTTLTLSPSVTKSFEKGGGTYEVSFANSRTVTSATNSTLNPFYSSNLSLIFTQPLMRNFAVDASRHNIRVQKKRVEQSDADFRRKTIDIIAQVQSGYWDLVFAMRDQQVQLDNVNLSRENLRQIEAQISAGAKAPLDRAEVLTELANRESTLLAATQTVSTAENALKQLMLKDTTAPQWTAQITPTDTPVVDTNPVVLDDALAEARKNRPELQRLRLQGDINKLDVQYFKNQTKPQVDLQSTFATTGLAGNPAASSLTPGTLVPIISGDPLVNANAFLLQQINIIRVNNLGLPAVTSPTVAVINNAPSSLVGGYGKDLANLFGFKTHNITVGVAISIPFKNTVAKENLAGALIQKDQLEASVRLTEESVEVDVRNAAQAVETARLRVVTSRAARENAEIQLEGEQRLYSVGRSTTFLLIQRQNTLANARDQEVRAETDYTKAVANLQHATSTTLHANNVIVDLPTHP
jgi:HAE1 family hydrophobic/amphiphilic exporter-1